MIGKPPSPHPSGARLMIGKHPSPHPSGARLMIGKPLGALEDAKMAVELDAKFIRAVVRVATCHLRLGEFHTARSIVDAVQDRLSPSSQVWSGL